MKEGNGCPVSVSVDLIPSMFETFLVMNSMAFCGESAVKTTTASWAPKVAQAPCTSIPDDGRFSRFFSSLVTEFIRGASALMRQTYPCFGKFFLFLCSPVPQGSEVERSLLAFNTFASCFQSEKLKLAMRVWELHPSRWSCNPIRLPQGSTRVPLFLPRCLTL